MDEEAAKANPFFDGRVAHGYLVPSFAAGLFVQPDPGPVLANYGIENLRFLTPVYPDDELTVTLTCKQIIPREDAGHGEVRWDTDVTNQNGPRGHPWREREGCESTERPQDRPAIRSSVRRAI
jgi:oxepin-CoA hydrolase / 3-oxo-5,6-dehydrosuberyl-CoA semialdehyde dehydrogenase